MATLNEIAYDIRNIARSTHGSTADKLSIDQIKFWVNSYRSLFIRRESENPNFNPTNFEATIFIPMESVPAQEYPIVFFGKSILSRSCNKIPVPIRTKNRTIGYVGSADFKTPIPFMHSSRVAYTEHAKYGGNIPTAYMINERLYITDNLKGVIVSMIPENPEELKNFKDQYGEMYSDDSEYPIPNDYAARIRDTILKTEIKALLSVQADNNPDNIQQ